MNAEQSQVVHQANRLATYYYNNLHTYCSTFLAFNPATIIVHHTHY